jgi:hypothetical protein
LYVLPHCFWCPSQAALTDQDVRDGQRIFSLLQASPESKGILPHDIAALHGGDDEGILGAVGQAHINRTHLIVASEWKLILSQIKKKRGPESLTFFINYLFQNIENMPRSQIARIAKNTPGAVVQQKQIMKERPRRFTTVQSQISPGKVDRARRREMAWRAAQAAEMEKERHDQRISLEEPYAYIAIDEHGVPVDGVPVDEWGREIQIDAQQIPTARDSQPPFILVQQSSTRGGLLTPAGPAPRLEPEHIEDAAEHIELSRHRHRDP